MLYQKFCTYIFNHENMQFKVDTIFIVLHIFFVFKLEKEENTENKQYLLL